MSDLEHKRTQDKLGQGSARPETWNEETKQLEGKFPKPPLEHRFNPSVFERIQLGLRTRTGQALAVAGLTLVAVAGVGTARAIGGNEASPPKLPDQNSALPEAGTKEVSIEGIKKQTTEKQIQYVLENPVNVSDYPTPEEQLDAIGDRFGAIINSARQDLDAEPGANNQYPFTEEFEPVFKEMVATIYDEKSPAWDTLYPAIQTSTQNTGNYLGLYNDVNTTITPIEGTSRATDGGETLINGTITDFSKSDPTYNGSMDVEFTLKTFKDGTVRIVHTQEIE